MSRLRAGEWTRGRRRGGPAGDALPAVVRRRDPSAGQQGRVRDLDLLNTYVDGQLGERLERAGLADHRPRPRGHRLRRWLAFANATGRPVAQSVAAVVLTATDGTFAFVVLALRALVFQPGPNDLSSLRYGAWLGLLAALILAVGGWWATKDERTDAPESAYTPPRAAPGAAA